MVKVACPQCNNIININFAETNGDSLWVMCPKCGNSFRYLRADNALKDAIKNGIPWESRMEIGFWPAIFDTIKSAVFSPKKMYGSMSIKGGMMGPLIFGLLIGSIGNMLSFFYDFLFSMLGFEDSFGGAKIFFNSPVRYVYLLFLSPALVMIEIFISSFIAHVLLIMVRGNKNNYRATFKVFAYSQAAMIWSIVPFIGSTMGKLWMAVIQIIGLKMVHNISYKRIIIALIIPFVFIVTAFLLLLLFFGIIIA
jgi:hypothetical protein